MLEAMPMNLRKGPDRPLVCVLSPKDEIREARQLSPNFKATAKRLLLPSPLV